VRSAESRKAKAQRPLPPHRPTAYKAEYARMAFQHTLIGATDADLAALFDVQESTINNWKLKHPPFLESLKKGKANADAKVAECLFKRATGYDHKAVKIFCQDGQTFEHEFTEHYPPDTTAQIFWLKNRRPTLFRQNPEVQVDVKVDNNVTVDTGKPVEEWGAAEAEAALIKMGIKPVTSRSPKSEVQGLKSESNGRANGT
jgi:hypothetical protein